MKFALRPELYQHKWPPKGGWRYRQPETQWAAPAPLQDNYRTTVLRIIQHRKANPGHNMAFDQPTVESDLQTYTALRILQEAPESASEWVLPLDEEATQKKTQPNPGTPSVRPGVGALLAGAIKRVRRDFKAARVLAEWLGEGGDPVSVPQANRRATVCVGCPHNVPGYKFEATVAEAILRHESIRTRAQLATSHDSKLETCEKCGCYLKLKVWLPIEKILRDKQPDDLPDFCWIKKEEAETKVPGLRVAYHGYIFDPTGFGYAARSYISALLDTQARVTITDKHRHTRNDTDPRIAELPPVNWASDVHIVHGIPTEFAHVFNQPITAVAMTAWETDRIHPKWVPILDRAHEVWVPCEHNRKVFAQKLRVPVAVIPHPAEREIREVGGRTDAIPEWGVAAGDFVYYSIFVWQVRKAPEAMLEAYLRAFKDEADRVFVMKLNPGCHDVAEAELTRLRAKTKSKARVSIVAETIPEEGLARLHTRGDCYVSLHRGEGFNLPLFQAVCRGKVAIATAYSGPVDYLDAKAHFPIPYTLVPVRQQYQFYTAEMLWADPSVSHAAEAMRGIDQHRSGAAFSAQQIAPTIRNRFAPSHIADLMVSRLKRL